MNTPGFVLNHRINQRKQPTLTAAAHQALTEKSEEAHSAAQYEGYRDEYAWMSCPHLYDRLPNPTEADIEAAGF